MTPRRNGSVHQLAGILCPQCGTNSSRVIDSREKQGAIKRRRECVRCGGRWNTIECVPSFSPGRKAKVAGKPIHAKPATNGAAPATHAARRLKGDV